MKEECIVSIIINNYNYGHFLEAAINSALDQTYENVEIIIVDDGSSDNSKQVIESYDSRIFPIFKPNGGQASAFNTGFVAARGEVIIFLDADDLLYPKAVENALKLYTYGVAKVHWPLDTIDASGKKIGDQVPKGRLGEGNFKEHALHNGPPFFLNPPTSGNAWSREFLKSVLPMPEPEFRIGADTYLFETSAFFGDIRLINVPQGCYRIHGANNYHNLGFTQKLQSELKFYDALINILDEYCNQLHLKADRAIWLSNSWFHKLEKSIVELCETIEPGSGIILIDDTLWGLDTSLERRNIYPFPERNGIYAGVPAKSQDAISELKLAMQNDRSFIVVAWTSFWWLDTYPEFADYLFENFDRILKNERIIVFRFKSKTLQNFKNN